MFPDGFLEYYRSQCKDLWLHFFTAAQGDPDGIHDLRVAIKQLRAFFKLIEALAPTFRARKNLRKIRALFKAAAKIRDLHVQQELTNVWIKTQRFDLHAYAEALKVKESTARKRFMQFAQNFKLAKPIMKNERKLIRALQALSPYEAAAQTNARITRLLAEMLDFGKTDRLPPEHLHQLRIRTKEARYTIEAARPCFPESAYGPELGEQLRGLHQVLGKWHDAEIALGHLTDFQSAQAVPAAERASYQALAVQLHQEKAQLLTAFGKKWNAFAGSLR